MRGGKVKDKWDKRFTEVAKLVSSWSKDPDNKVGAVLVSESNRILSTGFNGLPKGVDQIVGDKLAITLHAEVNCLIQATPWPGKKTLYVSRFPCAQCAALIVQTEVTRVVCPPPERTSSWFDAMMIAYSLLKEADISITYC